MNLPIPEISDPTTLPLVTPRCFEGSYFWVIRLLGPVRINEKEYVAGDVVLVPENTNIITENSFLKASRLFKEYELVREAIFRDVYVPYPASDQSTAIILYEPDQAK